MKRYGYNLIAFICIIISSVCEAEEFYNPYIKTDEKTLLSQFIDDPQSMGTPSGELKQTPFMAIAGHFKSSDIMQELIDTGLNVDKKDKLGNSAFHYLCAFNFNAVDSLELLAKHSKHLNTPGAYQMTPMQMALTDNQSKRFIEKLLDLGAKAEGFSIALIKGRTDLMTLLLNRGDKVNVKNFKKELKENDQLDKKILKIYPNFDFTDVNRDMKDRIIDFIESHGQLTTQKLDYIQYENSSKNTEKYRINGTNLKEILSMKREKQTNEDLVKSIDFNEYLGMVSILDDNLFLSVIKNGGVTFRASLFFQGETETRIKTWDEPDAKCQKQLDYIRETRDRMANCTNIMMRENSPYSYTKEMFQTCAEAEYNASKVYWASYNDIMKNCHQNKREKKYDVFTNGIALYSMDETPVLALPIQDGKLSYKKDIKDIPYKRVVEEIIKKYGNPGDTLVWSKDSKKRKHIHIFRGADWTAFVRVTFGDSNEITLDSEVIGIEEGFIRLDVLAEKLNALLPKSKEELAAEELVLYNKLKQEIIREKEKKRKEKEERINNFRL